MTTFNVIITINIAGSGTIIPVTVGVVLLLLAIGFLGWLYYASTHPVSASGKWLLEVSILLKYNIQGASSQAKGTKSSEVEGAS